MDSTLVARPPSGLFPTLQESPCFSPLLEALRQGQGLVVVTTASRRAFHQIWECIPATLKTNGKVIMSLSDGACLLYSDHQGNLTHDPEYQLHGAPGGTVISRQDCDKLKPILRNIFLSMLKEFQKDRHKINLLSQKYHTPLNKLLDEIEERKETLEAAVSLHLMTSRGAIMKET
uniref:Uncharacterized protein n=1 Tax=Arcella intermedia TaxID=1963864 RepID=A0A6B2LLR6_9EUKA